MRLPALPRTVESRLAVVSGVLLVTVLASAVAALAESTAPTAFSLVVSTRVSAGEVVAPTPVAVTFAKPQQPGRPARRRPPAAQSAPAAVPRTQPDSGCADDQRDLRGRAALSSLLHPVPTGVSISFLPGGGALKGMTFYDQHRVEVYVGSCVQEPDALLRHVVAHELGHAWDALHMTDALRARYLAARGIPAGTPWFGCDRCQDFGTPAGDFAETYAQWQRGAITSRSTLAPAATPAELSRLAAAFFQG